MNCPDCGQELKIGSWPFCGPLGHGTPQGNLSPRPVHDSEAAMVYLHPETGQVRYPGRADRPMPERYRQQGFEERRLRTLRELDGFCKSRGLVNHKAHYDSNGRGPDD